MDNHYHLLLTPVDDDLKNLSQFMKKLNMGYAKFFNEKHARSGYLWQGKYKKVLISEDVHFEYIPYYLHLNALDYTNYEWRTGVVDSDNFVQIKNLLKNYRWSSYLDYNGIKNFPSILYMNLLQKVLGHSEHQDKQIRQIVSGNKPSHTIQSNNLEK